MFVDRLTDYHAYEDVGYWQVPDELQSLVFYSVVVGNGSIFVHGHFYTLIGRSLMVFPLEQAKGGRL